MNKVINQTKTVKKKGNVWLSCLIVSMTILFLAVVAGGSSAPSIDNIDGLIDTTFGVNGRTLTDFKRLSGGNTNDSASSIAIQSDGKIVAAGVSNSPNGDNNFALVRYNTDGLIDITFGVTGRTVTDFKRLPNGHRSRDLAESIAIQKDGKIVAAGVSDSPNGDFNFALVRYNNSVQ